MIKFVQDKKFVLIIVSIILTENLYANAGSPMMWFSFLHLILINAIIGFVESKILLRLEISNKIGWIIASNYVSMFFGMYFIAPYFTGLIGYEDFFGNQTNYGSYNLYMFFIGMAIAFLATLIIEFPFYYLGIIKENRKKIFKGLIIANLITYFAMTMIYFLVLGGGGHF